MLKKRTRSEVEIDDKKLRPITPLPHIMNMKMQKLAICLTFWLGATSDAFMVHSVVRHNKWMIRESTVTTAEEAFETIGIEQEQLAIGVDPREFLNYIGT